MLIWNLWAHAQDAEIDSLYQVLETSSIPEDLANAHGRLAWLLMYSDLEAALAHVDSSKTFFEDLEDPKGMAISAYRQAVLYRLKGDFSAALDLMSQYHAFSISEADTFAMANGQFQKGAILSQMGNYDAALTEYFSALRIYEQRQDMTGVGFTKNSIALVYKNLQRYKESIETYNEIIGIHQQAQDTNRLANALHNLGSVYHQQGLLDQALLNYRRALSLDQNNYWGQSINYADIGDIYGQQQQYDSALYYLSRAYALQEANEYHTQMAATLANMGKVHLEMGNLRGSEGVLLEGLNWSGESKKATRELHFQLSRLYQRKGDYEKALLNYQRYHNTHDSIVNEQSLKNINTLQIEYETEKKDRELAQQDLQLQKQANDLLRKESQRNLALAGGGFLLLFSLGGWLYYQQRQRIKQNEILALQTQQDIVKLEALIQGEEKERVRLAQDLHDGINGDLAVIKYKITTLDPAGFKEKEKNAYKEAISMLDNAVEQIRRISHNLAPPALHNFDLIEAIRQYCSKVAAANPLEIDFQFYGESPEFEKETETAIYRMIQELLNNIVKHAEASEALVQLNHRDQGLHIVVEDNGTGFDPEEDAQGIGLQNVHSRVHYLQGDLVIDSGTGGTTVNIDIDLTKLRPL